MHVEENARDLVRWAGPGHLNLAEFCREGARWSGDDGVIHEAAGTVCFATRGGFPVMMNGALRVDDSVGGARVVAAADEWFQARGHGYSLWVRDLDADADLVAAAESAGLAAFLDYPEMVCQAPVDPPRLPPGVELRWVEDDAGVHDFVSVNAAAYTTYGMPVHVIGDAITEPALFRSPHVHSVVAYERGVPLAAAQTMLSHGIAGVYWVGTVEGARGKGLGEAVARAVTNRGFDAGAPVNTLQASSMGEPIYTRMGYETIHRYTIYVRADFAT